MGLPLSHTEPWKEAPETSDRRKRRSFPVVRLPSRFLAEDRRAGRSRGAHAQRGDGESTHSKSGQKGQRRAHSIAALGSSTPRKQIRSCRSEQWNATAPVTDSCTKLDLSAEHAQNGALKPSDSPDEVLGGRLLSKLPQEKGVCPDGELLSGKDIDSEEGNDSIWTVSSYSTASSGDLRREQLLYASQSMHGSSEHFQRSEAEVYFECSLDKCSTFSGSSNNLKWISKDELELDDAYAVAEQLVESVARRRLVQLRSHLKQHFNDVEHLLPNDLCEVHGSFAIQFPGGGKAICSYQTPPLRLKPIVYESEMLPRVGTVRLLLDWDTLERVETNADGSCRRVYFARSCRRHLYSSSNFRVSTPEVGYDIDRLLPSASFPDVFTPDTGESSKSLDSDRPPLQDMPKVRRAPQPKETVRSNLCDFKQSSESVATSAVGSFIKSSAAKRKGRRNFQIKYTPRHNKKSPAHCSKGDSSTKLHYSVSPTVCLKMTTV